MVGSLLATACLLLTSGVWGEDTEVSSGPKELFTTSLMKELYTKGKNMVFSPVSMESALGIVSFGAKGKTMEEMFTTLGYEPAVAKEAIAEKQKHLSEKPATGAEWESANRILIAPDLPVRKEYISEVKEAFPGAIVENINLSDTTKAVNEVNTWVSEKTHGFIPKLLEEDSITGNTRMLVLNAVYFKGVWKYGFDKKRTRKECFYSEPGKCTMTDMMHIKEDYKYGYHDDMQAQIIEFPYKNEDYSMVVVLPDERKNNLTNLISNLDVDDVIKFIDGKRWPVEVHVTLPKFEIEYEEKMKEPLIRMGMKNVFSDLSDLSGMISGGGAKVDQVIHKAKIICDEEGTTAAAATGVRVVPLSLIKPEHFFVANKPFLYFIKNKHNNVLFTGTKSSF